MFVDGEEFDASYETEAGPVWVLSKVEIHGRTLVLDELMFYSATGARLNAGVPAILRIFRTVRNLAQEQGFTSLRLITYRSTGARPKRMIDVTRRLV